MLLDNYGRNIDTLRISLTDKCNLRCFYCYDSSKRYSKELDINIIKDILPAAANIGIKRIKLTGGEPLMYSKIIEVITIIKAYIDFDDISITTNGILLNRFADDLKKAGLTRMNVSCDSLDYDLYKKITGGNLEILLQGIEKIKKLEFNPIKINTVILKDIKEQNIDKIKEFCRINNFKHQLINQMDLSTNKYNYDHLNKADRPPPCSKCNRIRLTSDGFLLPCLFSVRELNIKNFESYESALIEAVRTKPLEGIYNTKRSMNQIGG